MTWTITYDFDKHISFLLISFLQNAVVDSVLTAHHAASGRDFDTTLNWRYGGR